MPKPPKDKYAIHDNGSTAVHFHGEEYELIATVRAHVGAASFKETAIRALRYRAAHLDDPVDQGDLVFSSEPFLGAAATQETDDGNDYIADTLGLVLGLLNRCKDDSDHGQARLALARKGLNEAMRWTAPRQDTLTPEETP